MSRVFMWGLLVLSAWVIGPLRPISPAEARPAVARRAATPVPLDFLDLSAERTEYDDKTRVYLLAGKVRIRVRDLEVTCREAILEMDGKGEGLQVLRMRGQVKAVKGRQVFRGEQFTWLATQRRFVAEGEVEARVPWPAAATSEVRP
ncbi:MAG: hypothetical protein VKO21_04420 [Candidatus Sericytochromatia bacterium]|nr:hypothetical protein [Candidatus Sericytochromatia bacterium]